MARYRLQVLLELREQDEKNALKRLVQADRALAHRQSCLRESLSLLNRLADDRRARRATYANRLTSGDMSVADQPDAYRYLQRLRAREIEKEAEVEVQRDEIRSAEEEVEQARKALVEASQSLKAIQAHRDTCLAHADKVRARKADTAFDEMSQTLFYQALKDRQRQ